MLQKYYEAQPDCIGNPSGLVRSNHMTDTFRIPSHASSVMSSGIRVKPQTPSTKSWRHATRLPTLQTERLKDCTAMTLAVTPASLPRWRMRVAKHSTCLISSLPSSPWPCISRPRFRLHIFSSSATSCARYAASPESKGLLPSIRIWQSQKGKENKSPR